MFNLPSNFEVSDNLLSKISFKDIVQLPPQLIIMLVADANYTRVVFRRRTVLISKTLKVALVEFNCDDFVRVNKSHAINIRYLNRIDWNTSKIYLSTSHIVSISRRYKKTVKSELLKRLLRE
jgi:DNA-binding LytR/AlgR family response regulator